MEIKSSKKCTSQVKWCLAIILQSLWGCMYAYIVPSKIQLLSVPEASVTRIHDASSNTQLSCQWYSAPSVTLCLRLLCYTTPFILIWRKLQNDHHGNKFFPSSFAIYVSKLLLWFSFLLVIKTFCLEASKTLIKHLASLV